MPWRQHPDPTWQTQLNAHINAHTSTKKTCFVYICVYKYIYTHTHKQRRHLNFSQCIFKAARIHELTGMSRGDNLQTLLLQLWHVLSQHFSGKLSSFLFALSNIIPSLSKQLSSAVRLLPLCLSVFLSAAGGLTLRGGVGEQWGRTDRTRRREEERVVVGGRGHQGLWLSAMGEGSPGRSEGSGEKKEQKNEKREQVNRDMWRKKRGEEMEENVVLMWRVTGGLQSGGPEDEREK